MIERITASGHRNVTSMHKTTLEVTMDAEISKRADCIIGVKADKGLKDLSEDFKNRARQKAARIQVTIKAGDAEERITGEGHPELTFSHETDMVIRKSDFICPRTLMIRADKSSNELNPKLTERLMDPNQKIEVFIELVSGIFAPVAQTGQSD